MSSENAVSLLFFLASRSARSVSLSGGLSVAGVIGEDWSHLARVRFEKAVVGGWKGEWDIEFGREGWLEVAAVEVWLRLGLWLLGKDPTLIFGTKGSEDSATVDEAPFASERFWVAGDAGRTSWMRRPLVGENAMLEGAEALLYRSEVTEAGAKAPRLVLGGFLTELGRLKNSAGSS